MYLYLYHNDKLNMKQQSKEEMKTSSEFSEQLVRKALLDFSGKQQYGIDDAELMELAIRRDEKGKPYFDALEKISREAPKGIHYSVSHSGNWWGCLMAEEPVGFDLEVHREKVNFEKIAMRFFADEEYAYILSHGINAFFSIWVRKEAYVKYLGSGLGEGLSSFSVVEDGQFSPQIILKKKDGRELLPCFVRDHEIQSEVKAAYCSDSGNQIIDRILLV